MRRPREWRKTKIDVRFWKGTANQLRESATEFCVRTSSSQHELALA